MVYKEEGFGKQLGCLTASCPSEDAFRAKWRCKHSLGRKCPQVIWHGRTFFFFSAGKTPNEIQGSGMVLSSSTSAGITGWLRKRTRWKARPSRPVASLSKECGCCCHFYFIYSLKTFFIVLGPQGIQKWLYISAILYLKLLLKRKGQKTTHTPHLGTAKLRARTLTHDLKIHFKHTQTKVPGNSRFWERSSS